MTAHWGRGGLRNIGIAQLPGFSESLKLLVEREQYSLTDIAMMFGVTRERVRQLVEREGLATVPHTRGLNAVRVWDDTTNRFYPQRRVSWRNERRLHRAFQEAHTYQLGIQYRRLTVVLVLLRLRRELGREPMWPELEVALYNKKSRNGSCLRVVSYWSLPTHTMTTKERVRRFIAATGYVPYGKGLYPGNVVRGRRHALP